MSADQPIRVIVEVVSSADVKRLDAQDEDLRRLLLSLDRKIEGLHGTLYEFLESQSRRNK